MITVLHYVLGSLLTYLAFRELEVAKRHAFVGRGLSVTVSLVDVALTLAVALWLLLTA
jgi:hypothetical protein